MTTTKDNNIQRMLEALYAEFSLDFVGLAPVPDTEPPELMWKYAAGNANNRFKRIVLPPGIGVMGIVYGAKRPLVVENVNRNIPRKDQYQYPIVAAEGLVSFLALPLVEHDKLAAILLCAYRSDHSIKQNLLDKVAAFVTKHSGNYTASPENPVRPSHNDSEAVYDGLTQKILQAQEEERKRIARELHDGIAHEILLAQIELRKLKYLADDKKDEGISRASDYLRDIMRHVNAISAGLRPAQLDELGLGPAIKAYSLMLQDGYGVTINADIDETIKLPDDHEITLYRIFQEAALNACKYSRSDLIEVFLDQTFEAVALIVTDYGIGFDNERPNVKGGGFGIIGMKERSELIGGNFSLTSTVNEGTRVCVTLPIGRSKP